MVPGKTAIWKFAGRRAAWQKCHAALTYIRYSSRDKTMNAVRDRSVPEYVFESKGGAVLAIEKRR